MASKAAPNSKSPGTVRHARVRSGPLRLDLSALGLSALGWFAAIVATLGLTAWLIGLVVSDRFLWSQYLLWIPTLAALGFGALGLLAGLRPARQAAYRRWRTARWGGVLAALLIYFLAVENRPFVPAPAPTGIDIVHWNISPEENQQVDDPFAILFELNPDVAIVTDAWLQPQSDAIRRWRESGGQTVLSYPYTIFTRLPIVESRRVVARDRFYVTYLVLALDEEAESTVTIHAVDLPSDLDRSRMQMARELRSLIDAAEVPEPDVAIGDFNITRGAALNSIYPGYRHAFDLGGSGFSGTFPRAVPLAAIDHALVAPRIQVQRYEIIDPGLARHRLQRLHLAPP